jgi:hypothetical protein
MPADPLDRFRFDPHATGEEELQRRRAVAYHISGHAHWEGIKVSETSQRRCSSIAARPRPWTALATATAQCHSCTGLAAAPDNQLRRRD